jgi:hypothetical protein
MKRDRGKPTDSKAGPRMKRERGDSTVPGGACPFVELEESYS